MSGHSSSRARPAPRCRRNSSHRPIDAGDREHEQAPGPVVEPRPGPDRAPREARDERLKVPSEIRGRLHGAIDVRVAKRRTACRGSRRQGIVWPRQQETKQRRKEPSRPLQVRDVCRLESDDRGVWNRGRQQRAVIRPGHGHVVIAGDDERRSGDPAQIGTLIPVAHCRTAAGVADRLRWRAACAVPRRPPEGSARATPTRRTAP